MTSSCFSARSQSPAKHDNSNKNVLAVASVGFVLTSRRAASTAAVRLPASSCNFASFITVRASGCIVHSLDKSLWRLQRSENVLIEEVAAARLDGRHHRLAADAVCQRILAARLFLRLAVINKSEQSPRPRIPLRARRICRRRLRSRIRVAGRRRTGCRGRSASGRIYEHASVSAGSRKFSLDRACRFGSCFLAVDRYLYHSSLDGLQAELVSEIRCSICPEQRLSQVHCVIQI